MKLVIGFAFIYFVMFTRSNSVSSVDNFLNLINEHILRAVTSSPSENSNAFKTSSENISFFGAFDYIIVGAGSTGSVIANRLSEITENSILLLEAGGHETNFSKIPAMAIYLQGLEEFNWNYKTIPQTSACLGMLNNECSYPRGKGLGGSSIMNGLMYVRGNKRDFDNWRDQGNAGWSYEDILPYFMKSENCKIRVDYGYHGRRGRVNVEYHKPYSAQFYAFLEANLELGRKIVDYNGKNQLGVAKTQYNTCNGRRYSAGTAFLSPVTQRSNLLILIKSFVTKILIKENSNKAYGVLFSNGGKIWRAEARREIIISAGAINSPQLLMLSGIGPRNHLVSLEIPVVKSLDVGNNFQDHLMYVGVQVQTNYTEPVQNLKKYVEEYLNGYGPLTLPLNMQGVGFFRTNLSIIPDYPDIEIIIAPSVSTNNFLQRVFHFTDQTYKNIFGRINPSNTFMLAVVLLHPKSSGTLRLNSKNPYEYPLIDPRFLSDTQRVDIETLYRGIQIALGMLNTHAFKRLNATLVDVTAPACREQKYHSKEYWYCQLKQIAASIFHPIGTCKMGPNSANGTVVNHELKVHGVSNLRVADASIIPDAISGHPHAAAVMIGEKVSDMIKYEKEFLKYQP